VTIQPINAKGIPYEDPSCLRSWSVYKHSDEETREICGAKRHRARYRCGEYQETCANYDVLLLGPQVSYQLNTVKQGSGKPTAVIPAQDYGMGNAANVLALAQSLLG
jgi:cellobiose-specific phosphotransferase system component IIB